MIRFWSFVAYTNFAIEAIVIVGYAFAMLVGIVPDRRTTEVLDSIMGIAAGAGALTVIALTACALPWAYPPSTTSLRERVVDEANPWAPPQVE